MLVESRIQSAVILLACIIGLTGLLRVLVLFMVEQSTPEIMQGMNIPCLVMGALGGAAMWMTCTVPGRVPTNSGWRQYRPAFWIAAFYAAMNILITWRRGFLPEWQDQIVVVLVAGYFTVCGWGLAHMRAQRAAYMN